MERIFRICFLVFPARAGMSPVLRRFPLVEMSVPRASGDEPSSTQDSYFNVGCSPRERG